MGFDPQECGEVGCPLPNSLAVTCSFQPSPSGVLSLPRRAGQGQEDFIPLSMGLGRANDWANYWATLQQYIPSIAIGYQRYQHILIVIRGEIVDIQDNTINPLNIPSILR